MFSPKTHGLHLLAASLAANVVNALWPLPRSISTASTALLLSPTLDIEVNGPYPDDLKCAVARTLEYIQNDKHGRLVVCCGIGYAEALRSWWYPGLDSSSDAASVVQQGFRIVHAPSGYFYLDCSAGGWVGNNTNGNSWCDPFKAWQKAYLFDPRANISECQRDLVFGGQQLLWTEQSSPNNVGPIVWPRAAASAEVFWTGPEGDGDAALPRLHDHAYRMTQRGVKAIALQPKWCTLRPGKCDISMHDCDDRSYR